MRIKKLEELSISPAPWKVVDSYQLPKDGYRISAIESANGKTVSVPKYNDGSLIAAAPKLYEALRELLEFVEDVRQSAWWLEAKFNEIMVANKVMTNAEAALAEASGESEVN